MRKLNLDKNLLFNLYIKQKKSIRTIGKLLGIPKTTMESYFKKFNIPLRRNTELREVYISKGNLYDLYIRQDKNTVEIGKICKCSGNAILNKLKKFKIPTKHKGYHSQLIHITKKELYNLYIIKKLTTPMIAKIYRVSRSVMYDTLIRHHIIMRKVGTDIIGRCRGKNHHRFGKSMSPKFVQYKNKWFRSNWEVIYAKELDSKSIKWLYEFKTFDLDDTTYTPDFYLPKTDEYIEVKGYKSDIFIRKFKIFKQKYPTIKIKILDKTYFKKLIGQG